MRRIIDEPESRAEIHESLKPLYEALGGGPPAASIKAALRLLGRDVGRARGCPTWRLSEDEAATLRDGARAPRPAGARS